MEMAKPIIKVTILMRYREWNFCFAALLNDRIFGFFLEKESFSYPLNFLDSFSFVANYFPKTNYV